MSKTIETPTSESSTQLNYSPEPNPSRVEQSAKEKAINFILVADEELEECPFWIGHYVFSEKKANKINSDNEGLASKLKVYSEDGLSLKDTFVSVNTTTTPPTYLYMVPLSKFTENEESHTILSNLNSFSPKTIGIYLTKEFEKSIQNSDFFIKFVNDLLATKSLKDIYFYCPQDNYHSILNLISKIKTELEKTFGSIYIVH